MTLKRNSNKGVAKALSEPKNSRSFANTPKRPLHAGELPPVEDDEFVAVTDLVYVPPETDY
jgi:hypothetical protein